MDRILKEDSVPRERVAEFRGYLGWVAEQTARAGRIVSDLLAFSRRSKPHRAAADLNTIVRGTVSLVSHKLKLLGVEAELQLGEALPPLLCDASQVQQVVLNLVMNAAEATRRRAGGRVAVTTRRAPGLEALALVVSDPFFTTRRRAGASAWGWRWCTGSSSRTAAGSTWPAEWGPGPPSR